ncbi:MAG: hypothetical protein ACLTOK_09285 [Anaerobutyricum soehngenii]
MWPKYRSFCNERLAGQLEYVDFYDIAAYGNENWKGSYTPKEVAENAYDYYSDFQSAKRKGCLTKDNTIFQMLIRLVEDGSEEALDWANKILNEINDAKVESDGE